MSNDTYPKDEELTEAAILKAFKEVESWKAPKDSGSYTFHGNSVHRNMQLAHNRKALQDSVRHTLARLYLETTP